MRFASVLTTTLVLLLAGCSDTKDDDTGGEDHPLDSATYAIALSDVPALPVIAGQPFHFNSTITGDETHASDHIGAHFGNKTTTEPSTAVYNVTCAHQAGNLPGKYQVTCTAPMQPGVYYLRGHARITEGATVVNWWSPETTITVA